MRATFKGALAALAAVALAGCSQTGAESPTEAPSASLSPEIQKVSDVVLASDARRRLEDLGARYEDRYCSVHLSRQAATPEWAECFQIRRELARYGHQLLDDLSWEQPWPAEIDALASSTSNALRGVIAAAEGKDPEQMTLSMAIFKGSLQRWSALKG